jgi:hypothetical protein
MKLFSIIKLSLPLLLLVPLLSTAQDSLILGRFIIEKGIVSTDLYKVQDRNFKTTRASLPVDHSGNMTTSLLKDEKEQYYAMTDKITGYIKRTYTDDLIKKMILSDAKIGYIINIRGEVVNVVYTSKDSTLFTIPGFFERTKIMSDLFQDSIKFEIDESIDTTVYGDVSSYYSFKRHYEKQYNNKEK